MQAEGRITICYEQECISTHTQPPEVDTNVEIEQTFGILTGKQNGAYGERMVRIAKIHKIPVHELVYPEDAIPDANELDEVLSEDKSITHMVVVHCETTTGIINPIDIYGKIASQNGCITIVDAMSSFGAYPIDLEECNIDYLVSSANKCIEGVPGFSFIIARKAILGNITNHARMVSLDLIGQWRGLESDGQFRFTPPTHSLLAFQQALRELKKEGGISARAARDKKNYEMTLYNMQEMGFKPYLEETHRGYIITSFYYPDHANFSFNVFYRRLSEKGHVIYPGKLSHADCFRIGHIGHLDETDVQSLMNAIKDTLQDMEIQL